ncbi:unnamed protein product, partial [Phaeothamnion confervicola]
MPASSVTPPPPGLPKDDEIRQPVLTAACNGCEGMRLEICLEGRLESSSSSGKSTFARKSAFSEKLWLHGFSRNSTLTAATEKRLRETVCRQKLEQKMSSMSEQFRREAHEADRLREIV